MANFTLISMKKIRDGGLHVEWETTQDRYGIEQTVAGIIEELCEEVELYMLENKRADIEQASIGSDD